jgi:hypothetical protein
MALVLATFRLGGPSFKFTAEFIWGQVLLVDLPYLLLLLLLLVPFSRIQSQRIWGVLTVALAALSLWWFVPAVYRSVRWPPFHAEVPPGEGVPQKIIIVHEYWELGLVCLIFAFLLTQVAAICYQRRSAVRDS